MKDESIAELVSNAALRVLCGKVEEIKEEDEEEGKESSLFENKESYRERELEDMNFDEEKAIFGDEQNNKSMKS